MKTPIAVKTIPAPWRTQLRNPSSSSPESEVNEEESSDEDVSLKFCCFCGTIGDDEKDKSGDDDFPPFLCCFFGTLAEDEEDTSEGAEDSSEAVESRPLLLFCWFFGTLDINEDDGSEDTEDAPDISEDEEDTSEEDCWWLGEPPRLLDREQ